MFYSMVFDDAMSDFAQKLFRSFVDLVERAGGLPNSFSFPDFFMGDELICSV